ncbi:hypothetical protein BN2475_280022 [Paraburkholderia ribeironis]|uniref:Uncharacterized protein n=1 Tax=Paraburkholderia ribeironis TaxID=1247936 RepID=A0A1N7S1C1_9BURK|nr:hypothetical protein BN2475_280022 [Paraburkholderia ribeironis]
MTCFAQLTHAPHAKLRMSRKVVTAGGAVALCYACGNRIHAARPESHHAFLAHRSTAPKRADQHLACH